MARKGAAYDPRILGRIRRGEAMTAADYIVLMQEPRGSSPPSPRAPRPSMRWSCRPVPLVPPAIAEVEDEAEVRRINLLLLRNTTVGNFLDRCAISLPCHKRGRAARSASC